MCDKITVFSQAVYDIFFWWQRNISWYRNIECSLTPLVNSVYSSDSDHFLAILCTHKWIYSREILLCNFKHFKDYVVARNQFLNNVFKICGSLTCQNILFLKLCVNSFSTIWKFFYLKSVSFANSVKLIINHIQIQLFC